MPRQTSLQLTPQMERQLEELKAAGFGTNTDVIRIALDRMHQQERMNMTTNTDTATLEQELYLKGAGYTTAIEIVPGGKNDGLDYGPCVIEIVVLDTDGDTIAYRYSDDSIDEDWQLGTIEDAINAAEERIPA